MRQPRAVICVETGEVYRTAQEAADAVDGNKNRIQEICTGKRKSHKGYRWRYVEVAACTL